jgi:tripartite-type tricarboxylate transporter receptor subunit TctC
MKDTAKRRLVIRAAAAAALCSLSGLAASADAPRIPGPVRLVVGFSPGGSADILARTLAEPLRVEFNQPVIVDNRAGATGQIASANVKSSAPDGTTFLLHPMAPMALAPQILKGSKIDPRRDFVPIAQVAAVPFAIAVAPSAKSATLASLGEQTKKAAAGGQYAVPGIGGLAHLIGAQLSASGRYNWAPVAYKQALGFLPELTNGEISAAIDSMPDLLALHQTGKLRIIGVTTPERSAHLPDVPTLREAGLKDAEAPNWFGLYAPPGTSAELVAFVNQKVNAVLQQPEVARKLRSSGFEPVVSKPADLAKVLSEDYERWGGIIRKLKLNEE